MKKELFKECGRTLFGVRFHSQLAQELDCSVRAVERWADGSRNIPDLEEELKDLLKQRQIDIQDLLKRVC